MPSLYDGFDQLICDAFRIQDRQHLKRKSLKLEPLSDWEASRLVQALFDKIAENAPTRPRSASNQLWRSTREAKISDHNRSLEKMLEKSVAVLATQGHMPGWFNQCPVATGVVDPYADGGRRVDLVNLTGDTLRLIELKWHSDTPVSALLEVLEYGLAYLLARNRRREFNLDRQTLMQDHVEVVQVEVVGPPAFFAGSDHAELFAAMDKALRKLAAEQSNEISMSLDALVFPAWFDRVPFGSGKEVNEKCGTRILTDEGRRVCEAFEQLASYSATHRDRFLDGVPGNQIERILDDAAGNEIRSGKFDSPESSSALAVNTFGYFLRRPEDLPPLPDLEHAGWPARSLFLEKTVRFPWSGGRHPVLDCVLTTRSVLIGIECKRFEPFRGNAKAVFSETYWRPVWGNRMTGYQRVRDLLRADPDRYAFLDAAQLVKHALALLTEARERRRGLRPVLVYVYAEPSAWPRSGRPIEARDKTLHEEEIAQFADLVAGDAVEFAACSYRRLLSAWQHQSDDALRKHANAVMVRYSP